MSPQMVTGALTGWTFDSSDRISRAWYIVKCGMAVYYMDIWVSAGGYMAVSIHVYIIVWERERLDGFHRRGRWKKGWRTLSRAKGRTFTPGEILLKMEHHRWTHDSQSLQPLRSAPVQSCTFQFIRTHLFTKIFNFILRQRSAIAQSLYMLIDVTI